MFKKRSFQIILIIIGVAAVFLWLRFFGPLKPAKPAPQPASVSTEELNTVTVSGKVQAKNVANLTMPGAGRLSVVAVKEGDFVKKNQFIAALDTRQLKNSLDKSLNNYMTTRWDFEQTQDDYKDKRDRFLLTDADKRVLDKSQFSLNNSVLDVQAADLAIKLSGISSPITGIVTRVDTPFPGMIALPTSTFTVVDPSSVYFAADVDEGDISKVNVGQMAMVILDAYPDQKFEGTVQRINFVATNTAGGGTAFTVEIALPANDGLKFKVGMNGDAEIKFK